MRDRAKYKRNKRIIESLVNAPAAALRELIRQTDDPEERRQILRIFAALGVKLDGEK